MKIENADGEMEYWPSFLLCFILLLSIKYFIMVFQDYRHWEDSFKEITFYETFSETKQKLAVVEDSTQTFIRQLELGNIKNCETFPTDQFKMVLTACDNACENMKLHSALLKSNSNRINNSKIIQQFNYIVFDIVGPWLFSFLAIQHLMKDSSSQVHLNFIKKVFFLD